MNVCFMVFHYVGDSSKDHWWKILVDYHDTGEKCRVSVTGKIILCAGANMQLVYLITFLIYMFTGCHLPQRKHILDRQWIINDKKLKNCWLLHVKRIRVQSIKELPPISFNDMLIKCSFNWGNIFQLVRSITYRVRVLGFFYC